MWLEFAGETTSFEILYIKGLNEYVSCSSLSVKPSTLSLDIIIMIVSCMNTFVSHLIDLQQYCSNLECEYNNTMVMAYIKHFELSCC